MGECTSVPVNQMDSNYQKQQNASRQSMERIYLPKHIINMNSRPSENNLPRDGVSKSTSHPSAGSEADKNTKKRRQKRRRKYIRNVTFDSNHDLEPNNDPHSKYNISNRSSSSAASTVSNDDDTFIDYLDYNIPNLPIRFTKDHEIWNKEYHLFTEYISNMVYTAYINDDIYPTAKNMAVGIIEICLEFCGIDILYKSGPNLPISRIRGLWPQHYIHNISTNNLNENSMILSNIRDELIHSFNLQSIFEICGNYFSSNPSILNMKRFFLYGVDIDIDMYSSHNSSFRGYGSFRGYHGLMESHDGDTSTASSIGNYGANPLKFRIYSHNIMVCNKGFYIERHNEHYEQDEDEQLNTMKETQPISDDEPSYFFTLLLLPPNISTYQGGGYRFYGVEDNGKYQLNGNRLCSPAPNKPKLSSSSVLAEDKEEIEREREYVEVGADCNAWTWILFDKRVEYECGPIITGSAVAFKMDIDVWKKSIKEIKQYEESQETMNELLSGRLNVDLCDIDNMDDMDDMDGIHRTMSLESPTLSANIVFAPYPITLEDMNL